jgi:hypothetical protein
MSKPKPEPIEPHKLVELARAVVQVDRFPDLATMDGDQPRVRPVSPVRTDHFTVYVANLRSYSKTSEIAINPKVEIGPRPTSDYQHLLLPEPEGDETQGVTFGGRFAIA